jgi:hypothetical protein
MSERDSQHDISHSVFGLKEERKEGAPSEAPRLAPEPASAPEPWSFSGGQVMFLMVLALLILSGVNLYLEFQSRDAAAKQADEIKSLTKRQDSSDDRYAQLKAEFQVTSEKLGMTQAELARSRELASSIQKQQRTAVAQLNQAIEQKASADQLNQLQSDANNKFGTLSGNLAGTQKDLDATKEALMGTKGELSGAIARTHDELVALAHRTDRDYYEFSLPNRRARAKVGGIMIELEKTNPKKNEYTVDLFFDDKRTERKDQGLDSPVFFYVSGGSSALELVVNKLGKNSVSGYVSAPKGLYPNIANVLSSRPGI